jgi:hypothetical protein
MYTTGKHLLYTVSLLYTATLPVPAVGGGGVPMALLIEQERKAGLLPAATHKATSSPHTRQADQRIYFMVPNTIRTASPENQTWRIPANPDDLGNAVVPVSHGSSPTNSISSASNTGFLGLFMSPNGEWSQ